MTNLMFDPHTGKSPVYNKPNEIGSKPDNNATNRRFVENPSNGPQPMQNSYGS